MGSFSVWHWLTSAPIFLLLVLIGGGLYFVLRRRPVGEPAPLPSQDAGQPVASTATPKRSSFQKIVSITYLAGGAIGVTSVEESDPADWSRMFDLNVVAVKRVTTALLPLLREGAAETGHADIVMLTSLAGHVPYEGGGGYVSSKFAARAMTVSLEYLWPEMKRLKVDLVDEHFYRPESWFLSQGARYDNYDRKGPKVFAGEYACHGKGKKWNHFHASLLEAAFMTGLERNADIVHMATYAPLLAHVEGWQWRPDMIWFDNLSSVRTASYYVQQLYASYKGTNVLPLTMGKKPVTGADGQNGLFASAVFDKNKNEIFVKVVNTSDKVQPLTLEIDGLGKKETLGSI